jgi:hypothetical protein
MKSHNSRHHIIPRSRGGRDGDNIAYVSERDHRFYHALFENKTPREIIRYLNQEFWNGKYGNLENEMFK